MRLSFASSPRMLFALMLVAQFMGLSATLFATTDYPVTPGRESNPSRVIVGPDNNLWFAEYYGEKIGRITTGGTITLFAVAGAQSLSGLASGPDGNIWFTDQFRAKIGHITTAGGSVTTYSLPAGSYPQGLTLGPDGNLWFVDQKKTGNFTVGKITTAGVITEYAVGLNVGPFQPFSALAQIAPGPDGNLWFTNPVASGLLGKVTTTGTVTRYSLGDTPLDVVGAPDGNVWAIEYGHVAKVSSSGAETEYATKGSGSGITLGPDGALWFTDGLYLGHITTAGTLTEYSGYSFDFNSGIVSGPDSALWFVVGYDSQIGHASTSGTLLHTYQLNAGSVPYFNTKGPDGAIWFTEAYASKIVRISETGAQTSFSTITKSAGPAGIVTGPDGNLWFAESGANNIVKMTISGTMTEYPVSSGAGPFTLVVGPDGNLWFTEDNTGQIGRITTSGAVTEYPLSASYATPYGITSGPDGNLWFTETATDNVAKINPSTGVVTEYPVSSIGGAPSTILAGPDGNIWFLMYTSTTGGLIAAVNTSGSIVKHFPLVQVYPNGMVVGTDGAIWLPQFYPNSVARVTTNGAISTLPLGPSDAGGEDIAIGADGKLWVVDFIAGEVSRLSAISGTGANFSAMHGVAFTGAVASFVDGTPAANATDFTATISWGDGTKSAGTVSGSTGGPFTVKGTHTYAKAATFKVAVTLKDGVDKETYAATQSKATVN